MNRLDSTTRWAATRLAAGALALVAGFAVATPQVRAAGGEDPSPVTSPQAPARASYQHAVRMIQAGDYRGGLDELKALKRTDDANILNYMGYASRKLGRLSDAQRYYDAALKVDPRHRGAHEYYGELEITRGRIDNAKKHLATLKEICGARCAEYRELKTALEQAGHKVD